MQRRVARLRLQRTRVQIDTPLRVAPELSAVDNSRTTLSEA